MQKIANLLVVTGRARHGKGTICRVLEESYGYHTVNFGDPLKQLALAINPYILIADKNSSDTEFGVSCFRLREYFKLYDNDWEKVKKIPEVRRLLQAIGTEGCRDVIDEDIWIKLGERELRKHQFPVVGDLRFPNENYYTRNNLGAITIRVTRPDFESGVSITHPSEVHISTLEVDYDVINDKEISDLEAKIHELMNNEILPRINAVSNLETATESN